MCAYQKIYAAGIFYALFMIKADKTMSSLEERTLASIFPAQHTFSSGQKQKELDASVVGAERHNLIRGRSMTVDYIKQTLQLCSLCPARVVRRHVDSLLAGADIVNLCPYAEKYDAAVLFADISGFSKLAEQLVKELGSEKHAAEDLSHYVGKSLEKMVSDICDKGGDVIKFAGKIIRHVHSAKIV